MQFPIGGIVRERKLNRLDSGTDSIVWMEEERINRAPRVYWSVLFICV